MQQCSSLVPRPRPAFRRLQFRKPVEPGNEATSAVLLLIVTLIYHCMTCIHTLNTQPHTHTHTLISYCTRTYTHSTMVVAFAWKIIAIALAKKATVYALGRVRTVWSSMLVLPCVCQTNTVHVCTVCDLLSSLTYPLSLSVPLSSVSPCFLHPPLTLFSLLPLSLLQFFPPSSPHLSLLCLLLPPSSSIFLIPLSFSLHLSSLHSRPTAILVSTEDC